MIYHVLAALNRTVKSTGLNSTVTTALFKPVYSTVKFTHVNSLFRACSTNSPDQTCGIFAPVPWSLLFFLSPPQDKYTISYKNEVPTLIYYCSYDRLDLPFKTRWLTFLRWIKFCCNLFELQPQTDWTEATFSNMRSLWRLNTFNNLTIEIFPKKQKYCSSSLGQCH